MSNLWPVYTVGDDIQILSSTININYHNNAIKMKYFLSHIDQNQVKQNKSLIKLCTEHFQGKQLS